VAGAQVGSVFGMPVGVTPMNKFMPEILVKSFCSRPVEVNGFFDTYGSYAQAEFTRHSHSLIEALASIQSAAVRL
jgi:hypothetical protein